MSIHKEAIDQPNARDKREKKEPTSIQQEENYLPGKSPTIPNMTSAHVNVKRGPGAETIGSRRMSFGKKMREDITGARR
jgi:hypothetical protein